MDMSLEKYKKKHNNYKLLFHKHKKERRKVTKKMYKYKLTKNAKHLSERQFFLCKKIVKNFEAYLYT